MDIKELSRRYAKDQKTGAKTRVKYCGEKKDGLVAGQVYDVIDIVFYDKIEITVTHNHKVVSSAFVTADELEDPLRRAYDPRDGRIWEYDGKSRKIAWSKQMLDDLKRFYPDTPNREMAQMLGISTRAMSRKAQELGLEKDPDYMQATIKRNVQHAHLVSKALGYPGTYKKGQPATSSSFKKGHIPQSCKKVKRLDTGEIYNSGAALARLLNVSQTTVSSACRRKGNVRGIPVRFAVL